jgi:CubicO group peptidase (beta-lactamase class C family)
MTRPIGAPHATSSTPPAAAVILSTVLLALAATIAGGQPALQARPADTIQADRLERWLDWWFAQHLADPATGAPGAVVAVVKDDRVVLVKGYGYADLATHEPVGPDTVFRIGSVSKPFTASALMQLVEQGHVDLHAPVNRYLRDLQLPVKFGRAVTVLDLVTHTGGFDTRLDGTAAPDDRQVQGLGAYLRVNMPPQIRPSGEVLAYSNHGYTLLGHLVEQVSGERFEDYAAAHIFEPLGMRHSGFRLTPDLEALAATGYEPSPSGFRRSAPIHPNIYPAAGLNTTAADMARFMVAQLNGGRLGDARILSDASIEEMHRQQFTMSPAMPGTAFGFFEYFARGDRCLVHGGGIRGFMSGLALWPRERLGLFVSNNGYSAALVEDLTLAFIGRYFPGKADVPAVTHDDRQRASGRPLERFAGTYRLVSHPQETLEKAGALRGGDLEIATDYWHRLVIGGDRFVQNGPEQFIRDDGDELLGFREDREGNVTHLLTTDPFLGSQTWEKLRWYQTGRCHRELLVLFCLAFISALVVPYGRLARPGRDPAVTRTGPGSDLARAALFLVATADLLFLVLVVVAFRLERDTGMLYGVPALMRFDLELSLAAAAPALVLPVFAWRAWCRRHWSLPARVHYSLCVLAALGFAGFLRYWNLLGY